MKLTDILLHVTNYTNFYMTENTHCMRINLYLSPERIILKMWKIVNLAVLTLSEINMSALKPYPLM